MYRQQSVIAATGLTLVLVFVIVLAGYDDLWAREETSGTPGVGVADVADVAGVSDVAGVAARGTVPFTVVFGAGYEPFYPDGDVDGTDNNLDSGAFIEFLWAFVESYPQYALDKVRLPRVRMDKAIGSGMVDAFSLNSPLFVKPSDRDRFVFTDTIWTTADHVVVRADSDLEYSGPESLVGRKVGAYLGCGYGELDAYFDDGRIEDLRVTSQDQIIRLLLSGKVDAYIENIHAGPPAWKRLGYDESTLRVLQPPVYEFDLAIMVRKERTRLLRDLNDFIAHARENGMLDRINQRYGVSQ